MKKVNVAKADVKAVATEISEVCIRTFKLLKIWWIPALLPLKLLIVSFSLNRSYDTFVVPRLKNFMSQPSRYTTNHRVS